MKTQPIAATLSTLLALLVMAAGVLGTVGTVSTASAAGAAGTNSTDSTGAGSDATSIPDELSYNEHVGAIINENCVVCHRAGGIGPMQFETYDQVRPWAPLIALRVANREMPPYAYDHGIGIQELKGDWRLQQAEIDTIVAWVEQGAPLGDPDLLPPAPDLPDPDEWSFAAEFGPPDMIVPSSPYDIPATGNDLWSKEFVDPGMTTDRCIKAVQVKPRGDAKAVVHHANSDVYLYDENGELQRDSQLTEYAMGKWGELMPAGVCRIFPAESLVRWDIHMFPGGVGATAQGEMIEDNVVEIGIWFHEEGFAEQAGVYKQDLRLYPPAGWLREWPSHRAPPWLHHDPGPPQL